MTRASVLALGRAAAEAGMIDTCSIVRVTGTTTDPDTGEVTEMTSSVYSGACRVQEMMGFSRDAGPAPDQPVLARYRIVQLPVAASQDVRAGDRVTITASVNDPDLVGLVMVVRDQAAKSEATSRRIGVEEITS